MLKAASLLSFVLILSACEQDPEAINSSTLRGYAVSSLWPSGSIPTCWENGTSDTDDWRKKMQTAVENAFKGTKSVRFTGWDKCDAKFKGLHIEIYGDGKTSYQRAREESDGHPRAMNLGGVLAGARPGLILNPKLKDVMPRLSQQAANFDEEQRHNLQEAISIHEIGHALGLMHEHARSDSPCKDYPDSSTGGGVEYGKYDKASIMNYCVTHTNDYKKALTLSKGDIATLDEMYPKGTADETSDKNPPENSSNSNDKSDKSSKNSKNNSDDSNSDEKSKKKDDKSDAFF